MISGQKIVITGPSTKDVFNKTSEYLTKINFNFNPSSLKRAIELQNEGAELKSERLTIADMIKGSRATIQYATGKAASNPEILRRSRICEACELKATVSDCMSCGASGKISNLVNTIRSARGQEVQIPKTISDKFCGVCKCSLATLVVTKFKDLATESEQKQNDRPDYCWLKKTSTNFTKE